MKKTNIIFWISTSLIFLLEGVVNALTSRTEIARESIRHLGYPAYFGMALMIFQLVGALALIIPQIPKRIKEWAYAGFVFDTVFAFISLVAVDGLTGAALSPLIALIIIIVSYVSYHKRQKAVLVAV